MYVCMHAFTNVGMHACTNACMYHIGMYECNARMYVYTYKCIYVYVYIMTLATHIIITGMYTYSNRLHAHIIPARTAPAVFDTLWRQVL